MHLISDVRTWRRWVRVEWSYAAKANRPRILWRRCLLARTFCRASSRTETPGFACCSRRCFVVTTRCWRLSFNPSASPRSRRWPILRDLRHDPAAGSRRGRLAHPNGRQSDLCAAPKDKQKLAEVIGQTCRSWESYDPSICVKVHSPCSVGSIHRALFSGNSVALRQSAR